MPSHAKRLGARSRYTQHRGFKPRCELRVSWHKSRLVRLVPSVWSLARSYNCVEEMDDEASVQTVPSLAK
jgi:hypothetical protein